MFYSNNLPVSTTANLSFDNSNSFSKPGSPEIKNVFNGIFTNDYTIDYDITWAETEVAFVIGNYSGLRMEDMATLTLADNVVLKFDESSNFDIRSDVSSIINYNGNGVFFTSIKDDSLKGDANGDGGSSAPAIGDWDGVIIDDGPLTYAGWPNILFAANP